MQARTTERPVPLGFGFNYALLPKMKGEGRASSGMIDAMSVTLTPLMREDKAFDGWKFQCKDVSTYGR